MAGKRKRRAARGAPGDSRGRGFPPVAGVGCDDIGGAAPPAGGLAELAELAELAAQLLDEHGLHGYEAAKRSAARRLRRSSAEVARLDNRQIAEALRRRQSGPQATAQLTERRREALRAMDLLADFSPRATGGLLDGLRRGEPGFTLHLFADAPEPVLLFLAERRIPAESGDVRLRFAGGIERDIPELSFLAGPWRVRLLIFDDRAGAVAPLAEVDGKPLRRLNRDRLAALL